MVCRSKRYIKERTYTNHRIKPETKILKKTELESRSKEESDYIIPIKSVGHFTNRIVKQREETRGIYQKETCTQPDYKGIKEKII